MFKKRKFHLFEQNTQTSYVKDSLVVFVAKDERKRRSRENPFYPFPLFCITMTRNFFPKDNTLFHSNSLTCTQMHTHTHTYTYAHTHSFPLTHTHMHLKGEREGGEVMPFCSEMFFSHDDVKGHQKQFSDIATLTNP